MGFQADQPVGKDNDVVGIDPKLTEACGADLHRPVTFTPPITA
jgi:hypothetical protein